MAVFSSYC